MIMKSREQIAEPIQFTPSPSRERVEQNECNLPLQVALAQTACNIDAYTSSRQLYRTGEETLPTLPGHPFHINHGLYCNSNSGSIEKDIEGIPRDRTITRSPSADSARDTASTDLETAAKAAA